MAVAFREILEDFGIQNKVIEAQTERYKTNLRMYV